MKVVLSLTVAIMIAALSGCGGDTTVKDPNEEAKQSAQKQEATPSNKAQTDEPSVEVVDESPVVEDATSQQTQQADIDAVQSKMNSVYFDFDKFNLRSDMREVVAQDSDIVKNEAATNVIKVEGNCDEWGSDEYNYALGLKRAATVKKEMINSGVDASNITLVSLGKSNPVCQEKTQECWSKNRRVDLKILP